MTQFNRLDPLLRSFVEKGPAGCALTVTRNGEELYRNFFGYADLEAQKPIDSDTIYRIYSMTKVVTCAAALMLYERGLFLLNDPLEEYLPEFKNPQVYRYNAYGARSTAPAAGPIRVKDLFMMTSGLTYGGGHLETARQVDLAMQELGKKEAEGTPLNVRALSKALAAIPLAFDPGTHWSYGLSHDVLGALIEVISGRSFEQFLKEEIFEPLGMKDTFFRIPEEKKDRLCTLYNRSLNGKLTPNTSMDTYYQPGTQFESGGAGLLSTLEDYSRFARMLAQNGEWEGQHLLSPHTIRLMSTNHLGPEQMKDYDWQHQAGYGYGLGVRVMVDPPAGGSSSSLGEFGWCGMAGTWVLIDPKEKLSAVYMQQMLPNFEEIHQPRIRNVIYGAL